MFQEHMISGYAVWGKVAAYENFQGGGGFSGSAEFLESASLKKVPPPSGFSNSGHL